MTVHVLPSARRGHCIGSHYHRCGSIADAGHGRCFADVLRGFGILSVYPGRLQRWAHWNQALGVHHLQAVEYEVTVAP